MHYKKKIKGLKIRIFNKYNYRMYLKIESEIIFEGSIYKKYYPPPP